MMELVIIGAAVAPALFLVFLFVRLDRFPEPARVILGTFFWGLVILVPVLAIALPLDALVVQDLPDPVDHVLADAFLLAAIPEETLKFAVLLFYCARHGAFDEPMDGVVYGATASLGFAALENILYVAGSGGDWAGTALLRALTAVPIHALLGAIMGLYLGRARFEPNALRHSMLLAWAVPVLLHGLYDFPLLGIDHGLEAWLPLSLGVLILMIVLVVRLMRRLRRDQAAQLGS